MINLNIKIIDIKGPEYPFVVILRKQNIQKIDKEIPFLNFIKSEAGVQIWKSELVELSFSSEIDVDDGEIWLVFPANKSINRFYRPSANSNTMMLTERCDQYCIMCSQPPKNKDLNSLL